MFGLQVQAAFLGADQAILHHMGHADAGVHPDNSRRALERVRGAHAGFQLVSLSGVALQGQQARAQYLGLRVGFQAEQLQQ